MKDIKTPWKEGYNRTIGPTTDRMFYWLFVRVHSAPFLSTHSGMQFQKGLHIHRQHLLDHLPPQRKKETTAKTLKRPKKRKAKPSQARPLLSTKGLPGGHCLMQSPRKSKVKPNAQTLHSCASPPTHSSVVFAAEEEKGRWNVMLPTGGPFLFFLPFFYQCTFLLCFHVYKHVKTKLLNLKYFEDYASTTRSSKLRGKAKYEKNGRNSCDQYRPLWFQNIHKLELWLRHGGNKIMSAANDPPSPNPIEPCHDHSESWGG